MRDLPRNTRRLRLVQPEETHRDAHEAFLATPRGRTAMARRETGTFDALLNHHDLLGYGPFVAVTRDDDTAIGVFGPWNVDSQPDPEIVFMLWNPANEGKGLAHEATVAARAFANWVLGWRTAVSYIAASNERATGLAIRLGALRDGTWTSEDGQVLQVWRHPDPEAA